MIWGVLEIEERAKEEEKKDREFEFYSSVNILEGRLYEIIRGGISAKKFHLYGFWYCAFRVISGFC